MRIESNSFEGDFQINTQSQIYNYDNGSNDGEINY